MKAVEMAPRVIAREDVSAAMGSNLLRRAASKSTARRGVDLAWSSTVSSGRPILRIHD
jgi:hypothetical protein